MVTQLAASPPAQRPPDQHHEQTTDTPPPRRPSPMSLVNFSFTQFFVALDEVAAEEQRATAEAIAAAPVTATSTSSAVLPVTMPHTTQPLANAATLSLHDCVLLKLSLTCALCGRLLRHQPAAIETCGHCFCYECINTALENGCAPRTIEWPWCTLEKEVGAAEVRWAAATVVSTSAKSLRASTAAATPGGAPQATEETADGQHDCDEVQVAAPLESRAARSTDAQPPRQPRKLRKVHQMCPLCLGPAFKWMLVPLQPLADLCNSLHSAYPGLEGALGHLTATTSDSAVSITESRAASENCDEAGGEIDGDMQWHVQPASDSADLITAAFAPRSSVPGADDWQSSQDEEAERRRRRSTRGPRKEITFAADIASRVSSIPAPVTADAQATVNQTSDSAADIACVAHSAGVEAIEEETPISAEAEEKDGGVAGAAVAAVLQLSADLIPSPGGIPAPALPAATTQAPRDIVSSSSWQRGASLNALAPTPLSREEVLGHSPTDAKEDEDTQQGGKRDVDAVVNLHLAPVHQHEKGAQSTAVATSTAAAPQPLFLFFTAQRHHRLLLDTVPTPSDKSGVPWPVTTSPTRKEEADGWAPPSTRLPAPLGSIDAILRARASSTSGWSVVWDGVEERKSDDSSDSDEGCPTTRARSSQRPYSTVQVAELGEDECAAREERRGNSDVGCEHRHPVPATAFSGVSRHTVKDALTFVHMQDVWELHTALVRRHPRLPPCFVALRHGRVRWQADVAAEEDDSESAADSTCNGAPHPPPPILCVVGHYPQQACRSDSSGLRLLPTLTPTACTALVLGVPCVDMTWVASPTSSPWTAHAVSGWQTNTAVVDGTSSPSERERQRPNAFQNALERLTAASGASSQPQRLAEPLPASWMATTQRALLAHLHPTAQPRDTQKGADTTAAHAAVDTYVFFLLPDGATRQLGKMLYHQWTRAELWQSPQAKDAPPTVVAPLSSSSRKRRRDGGGVSGIIHGIGNWSATDGHPQRAWRRLLLVAGGAAVELSWTLFEALVATAVALEDGDSLVEGRSATGTDSLVKALTSHLRHRRASGTGSLWIHVDVADCEREPSPPPSSAASPVHSCGAQHTLFLLYSMAVARDVFAQLVAEKNVRGKTPCTSPSSSSPAPGDHSTTRTRAYLRRFKVFLDRLAALVAVVAAPALPGSASLYGGASHQQEARPSSWLLENIAQGRRSAGSSVNISALSQTQEDAGDVRASSIIRSETQSSGEQARRRLDAASLSTGECGAEGERQVEGAAPLPAQRAGVYRSLLYADTP
ncbi:conserved RING finger protein [Leishmania major strain Friedlin]|uniref:Conserved RING finger protein n=1 Tax=Leishmania major TaxID=5664 RepID=E9AEP1_LEIMA|nr:conserved RING finger protein [Leishmania major strain Friedlin]CAG9582417.1 RING_finger_protein_-_conserved [Leishmania major strain Friedlin]CBZ12694.1 conserved RING finger protein [Leishmania major strain Friedlin]|eukprot:XP_003722461.1 conserved RING finger protein [Leishmania major strain Friedlin]